MLQRIKTAGNQENRTAKRITRAFAAIFLAVCLVSLANWVTEGDWTWKPDYQQTDLSGVVIKNQLTDADYQMILMQTGLGRDAVDKIRKEKTGGSRVEAFDRYQNDFFWKGAIMYAVFMFLSFTMKGWWTRKASSRKASDR